MGGLIPEEHEAAAVFVARYITTRREDKRAFSDAGRARRWIEDQLEQSLEWSLQGNETWIANTDRAQAKVQRIPLHDPLTLRRRYESAFSGNYHKNPD